jgi:hypothetical protein
MLNRCAQRFVAAAARASCLPSAGSRRGSRAKMSARQPSDASSGDGLWRIRSGMHRVSLVFVLVLSSVGCGTALNYIPTREPPHTLQARSASGVEVFMTGAPGRPYVELGMIEAQQEGWSRDGAADIVAKMREFAGERGCDALVIFSSNDAVVSSTGENPSVSTLKGYRGSCLAYVDGAEPLPVGTPPPPPSAATSCIPNATQLCYGPGGCRGAQRCTETGRAYTLCDCE